MSIKYTPLPFDTRFSIHARYGVAEGLQWETGSSYRAVLRWRHQYHARICLRRGGTRDAERLASRCAKELIFNYDFIFTISSEAKLNGVIFFDYGKGFTPMSRWRSTLAKVGGV